jgi:DsbC/DsbD-like thiol-disulfide interchange protein
LQKSAVAVWGAVVLGVLGASLVSASATEISSPWVSGHNFRTRLVAGSVTKGGSTPQHVAGIEIRLTEGWKTYWRMPGDAGGIPPNFNWAGSTNLAGAKVLFPAPQRLADAAGDSVGYKDGVVFPVHVTPRNPAQPVELKLALEYGICREICVPVEAKLSLLIPPDNSDSMPAAIATALEGVPRASGAYRKTDPDLVRATATLSGEKPSLVFEVAFPGGTAGADLFIEAPDGLYVGLPQSVAQSSNGVLRFEVELANGISPEELRGKTLLVTMVSDAGVAETSWKVE